MTSLESKKVAILVANGFEQAEMTQPREALMEAGAQVVLISPEADQVQGWHHYDKADYFPVDLKLQEADPSDYDALLLPGGTVNPDQLRTNPAVVQFVKAFFTAQVPVAAICHGPWTLIEADAVRGRTVTSWPSLATDLKNAGAHWVDQEVVTDDNLITSRNPDDIPVFNQALIKALSKDRKAVAV